MNSFLKLIPVAVLCGSMISAPVAQASNFSLSLGEPLSMEEEQFLENSPFAELETVEDSMTASDDLSVWTDDQIENVYGDDLEFTRSILEEVTNNPFFGMSRDFMANKNKKGQMSALSCMALAIQGEAGAEPYAGKVAVGETIMARAKGQASKVCSVIFAKAQFESMSKRVPKPNADSVRAAKAALAKGGKCGYDHFINKKLQRKLGRKIPQWVRNFEKWGCATKTIGQHTFYSSCNCKRKK